MAFFIDQATRDRLRQSLQPAAEPAYAPPRGFNYDEQVDNAPNVLPWEARPQVDVRGVQDRRGLRTSSVANGGGVRGYSPQDTPEDTSWMPETFNGGYGYPQDQAPAAPDVPTPQSYNAPDPYSTEALSTPAMPPPQAYYRPQDVANSDASTFARNVGRAVEPFIGGPQWTDEELQASLHPRVDANGRLIPNRMTELGTNAVIGSVGNGPHLPGAAGEGIDAVIARLRAKGLTPAEAMHDPEFIALQAKSGFMPDYNAKPADAVNANDVTVNLRRAREADARVGDAGQQGRMDAYAAELSDIVRNGRRTNADLDRKNQLELLLGYREPRPGEGPRTPSLGTAELGKPWPTKAPLENGYAEPASSVTLKNGREVSVESYGDAVGSGGYNGGFLMRDAQTGERMGYIDYQSHRDIPDVQIAMVQVEPQFRRAGIADTLLERLRAEFPDRPISPGMVTDDGSKWVSSLQQRGIDIGRASGRTRIDRPAPTSILERARAKANEPRLPDTETQQQAIRAVIRDERQHAGLPSVQEQQNTYIAALENAATVEPGNRVAASIGQGFEDSLRVMQQAEQAMGPEAALQVLREHRRDASGFPRALELIDNRIKALSGGDAGFTTVGNMLRPGVTNALGAGAGGVAGYESTPSDAPMGEKLRNAALGAGAGLGLAAAARRFPGDRGSLEIGPRPTPEQAFTTGAERQALKQSAASERLTRIVDTINDIVNVPRTTLSSIDLSGSLRQAGFMAPAHASEWKSAMGAQLRSLVSEDAALKVEQEIAQSPMAKYREGAGLYQAAWDGADIGPRDEQFASRMAGNLPLVKQTSRAYAVMLNKYRADIFDRTVAGWPEAARTPERLQQYATYVNAATGRGSWPQAFDGVAKLMNGALFSPRFLVSIPQRHLAAVTSDPYVRKEVLKDLGSFYGTGLSIIGSLYAAKQAGILPDNASIDTDFNSPDWGKLKVGNTRYDIWGGQQQFARMMLRVGQRATQRLPGSTAKPTQTELGIIGQFLRYKFSPPANLEEQLRTGKDVMGQPAPGPVETAVRLVAPLLFQDMYDAYQVDGPKGAAKSLPSALGLGVQTYTPTVPKSKGGGGIQKLSGGGSKIPGYARGTVIPFSPATRHAAALPDTSRLAPEPVMAQSRPPAMPGEGDEWVQTITRDSKGKPTGSTWKRKVTA